METSGRERLVQGCIAAVVGLCVFTLLACCAAVVFLPVMALQAASQAIANIPTPTRVGGYSAAALSQLPEAQLVYPGADVLSAAAREEISGLAKPWYAVAAFNAGTQASAPDVERWYDQQLRARGWVASPGAASFAHAPPGRTAAWERGGLVFELTFGGLVHGGTPTTGAATAYATLFSVQVSPRR